MRGEDPVVEHEVDAGARSQGDELFEEFEGFEEEVGGPVGPRATPVEQRVGKVDRWTTSDQKQRWLAATVLELEPRLRRLRGYRALPQLRTALTRLSSDKLICRKQLCASTQSTFCVQSSP
jgi:hypothetical protein